MGAQALEGGFKTPSYDASFAFRALMTAMARPGQTGTLDGAVPPAPMSVAAGTALLTLADADTPIFLAGNYDTADVRQWLAFHTGAPIADRSQAVFAVGRWDALSPLEGYPIGTPEYPDRSTTLIIDHADFALEGARLTGPGIKESASFALPDPKRFAQNNRRFPLGLDFYFTNGLQIAALPRSTRIG